MDKILILILKLNTNLNNMEYEIKEFQTGLDVVSQLFGNQDNIGTLMLNNVDFDINKMQQNMILDYETENNKTLNEIKNNNYTFINRENVVYNKYETVYYDKGYYLFANYSSFVGRAYIVNESNNDSFFLEADSQMTIYEDNTPVSIYIEYFE
jgi:hypothetical protein